MGSISIEAKRASTVGSWGSWGPLTGTDIVASSFNDYVVYGAVVTFGANESKLISLSIEVPIRLNYNVQARSATVTCYLYKATPSGSNSIPTNYYRTSSRSGSIGYATSTIPFEFSNIEIPENTDGNTLIYFLISASYNLYDDGVYAVVSHDGVTASGTFNTTTPEPTPTPTPEPTMSLVSGGIVNNNMVITVINGNGKSLTADFYKINENDDSDGSLFYSTPSFTDGKISVPVKTLFDEANITNTKTFPRFRIKVNGGNPNPLTGNIAGGIQATDDMKPTVSNLTTALVQRPDIASAFPSVYISGVSSCDVRATVGKPTKAAITQVVLTCPGKRVVMEYNSSAEKYSGTVQVTQDVEFTVTATDARGMSTSKKVSLTGVQPYTTPSVIIESAYRCDSNGAETPGGPSYKILVTPQFSDNISGNAIELLEVGIKGEANPHNIKDGNYSAYKGPFPGLTDNKASYTLVVYIKDKISSTIQRECVVAGIQRDFVINHTGNKTHLGIGTTPVSSSVNSIELPSDGLFLIGGIPAQAYSFSASEYTDGRSFGRDFHNFNGIDKTAPANAACLFMFKPGDVDGVDDPDPPWTSFPVVSFTVDGTVSNNYFKEYGWSGLRSVYILNKNCVMVQVIEFAPTPGNIWFDVRLRATEGSPYEWVGWRYHPVTRFGKGRART